MRLGRLAVGNPSAEGKPSFATIVSVATAFGLKIEFRGRLATRA